ncbi:gamma-butyrobetaine hydroxylase-like domain-containing protein, partial [Piscinibacter sp.]|uniref:gamma-butyrobetaine hydroxylase-like domain-containing protein n=1 Tax=Piscinibacter sp. TaxID=1903157 RepID=UPI002F403FF8
TGKRDVGIVALEPIGNYAVKPVFSDGHETGIYSWDYLYRLGSQERELWQRYEQRLAEAGADRDAPMASKGGEGCGHHH